MIIEKNDIAQKLYMFEMNIPKTNGDECRYVRFSDGEVEYSFVLESDRIAFEERVHPSAEADYLELLHDGYLRDLEPEELLSLEDDIRYYIDEFVPRFIQSPKEKMDKYVGEISRLRQELEDMMGGNHEQN